MMKPNCTRLHPHVGVWGLVQAVTYTWLSKVPLFAGRVGMKITLQQMRYMLKIAETGSMVAASRVLSVSQPSLSEAVSVVERELGFSLFTRGNTGATPTKEGMEFLGRARQVVLQMDNLERCYGGNQPEGMRFAVSSHHFTFVERAFLDVAQQVGSGRFDLVLNETQTQQIIDDVARCDSDLGVMYLSRANEGAVGRVLDRNKLEFYELFEAVPHVFLRFGHPLAGRESVSLDDLYPYPQLSFVQGAYESSAFSEEPLWAPSAKTVKVSDRGFATSFMLHSDAYTVTSGVYPEFLQRGAITAVPIRSGERMHIGYVMPRGLTLDAIGEAFVAAMKLYAKVEG